MRTFRLFSMAALALVMAACSNEDNALENAAPAKPGLIPFSATVAPLSGATTRTVYTPGTDGESKPIINVAWKAGDQIYLYDEKNEATCTATVGTPAADGSAAISGTITGSDGDEVSAYYPATVMTDWEAFYAKYNAQEGTLDYIQNNLDLRMGTGTLSVSGTEATLATALQMESMIAIWKLTLQNSSSQPLAATKVTVYLDGGDIASTTNISGTSTVYLALPLLGDESIFPDIPLTIEATVGSDTYTYSKSDVTLARGKYYQSTVTMEKQAAAPAGAEAVDLGLPSGTKWANMNVGATSVGDYGQFFAWGETTGYGSNTGDGHNFGWASYSLCGGSNTTLTKYNNDGNKGTVDNKTTLEAADDAATANWGSNWRMPTYDELNELYATKSNTTDYTWTWTTVDGHNGYRITYKSTGANIFLPASGHRNGTSLNSQGTDGSYWSSSLHESNARSGRYLNFDSGSASMGFYSRFAGQSVRPVQGAPAPAVPTGALSGEFSVSAGTQVYFSQGNLQATTTDLGATWAWAFAANQYDYIGNAAANTSINGNGTVSANGTVDLFGWSTSTTTYGMSTSISSSDYSGDFVDWGATMGTGWFTLSKDEWTYLFNSRSASTVGTTEDARYAKAKVNDKQGVILFPDTYTHPSDVTAPIGINATDNTGWNGNSYTVADWTKMESAGCVFLPAAGHRYGVNYPDTKGNYWSATPDGEGKAYFVYFSPNLLNPADLLERYYGYSVRLVRQVE